MHEQEDTVTVVLFLVTSLPQVFNNWRSLREDTQVSHQDLEVHHFVLYTSVIMFFIFHVGRSTYHKWWIIEAREAPGGERGSLNCP